MTAETTSARERLTRARLAFRRWRRSRPFWGGLLLLLSGALIFYSGNLDLGNLQVHLGLPGFQSYVIPLVLALCGLLGWFSPAQRIFYGVIGLLAAVYSLVGANLGGFVLGFVVGTFGGGLMVAWVPHKHPSVASGSDTTAHHEDIPEDVQESQGLGVLQPEGAADDAGQSEGDTTQPPLVPTQARHAQPDDEPAGDDEAPEGKQGERFPRPRHAADQPDVAGETQRSISTVRWSPRTVVAIVTAAVVAAIGAVTLPTAATAAAETCASQQLTQLLNNAKSGKISTKPGAENQSKAPSKKRSTGTTSKSTKSGASSTSGSAAADAEGSAVLASVPAYGPIDPITGLIGKLLGDDPTPDPSPSAAPSSDPTPDPTPSTDPTPSPKPSGEPTTGKPTGKPTDEPKPPSGPGKTVTPSPSPSVICSTPKQLDAPKDQPNVADKPGKMTATLETLHGLSFDGVVDLPTHSGTVKALQFSMDSAISTPFDLQPAPKDGEKIDIKSSQLTVSGNVKFYCSEMKGNLLGVVPVDFTVDSPPPLVLQELFFTDVTFQLVFVYADELTADNLDISVS